MLSLRLRRYFNLNTATGLVLLISTLVTQSALAALISVSPTAGPPGTEVAVTGSDWPPNDVITLSWHFPPYPEITSVHAAADGTFKNTKITVPQNAPIGKTFVDAINAAGNRTWQAGFTVIAGTQPPTPTPEVTPTPAQPITLSATVRDFCGIGFDASTCPKGYKPHSDFQNWANSDDHGLVDTTLGKDRTPVPIANFPTTTVKSAESFNQWYHDTAGINRKTEITLTLTETPQNSGVYLYNPSKFFPIDNQLLGNQGYEHNTSFTLALHASFTYEPNQYFEITADDTAWVFINNQLAIDLGGTHPSETGSVNLDTLGLISGKKYNFDLFFAERQTWDSQLKLQTSIVFESSPQNILETLKEYFDSFGNRYQQLVPKNHKPYLFITGGYNDILSLSVFLDFADWIGETKDGKDGYITTYVVGGAKLFSVCAFPISIGITTICTGTQIDSDPFLSSIDAAKLTFIVSASAMKGREFTNISTQICVTGLEGAISLPLPEAVELKKSFILQQLARSAVPQPLQFLNTFGPAMDFYTLFADQNIRFDSDGPKGSDVCP